MILNNFEEFLRKGIVKKVFKDNLRVNSIINEAERKLVFLKRDMLAKIKLVDDNSNDFIEKVYDILIELIRAKLLKDGFKAHGEGAHEAEVSYMRKIGFNELDVSFMNELRYFRNGIKYYGKRLDKKYAEKVLKFLNRLYLILKTSLNK
ncbi:MAG TPA: hypothetical protein VJA20_02800 [Candidatus Nanoarchaeia archaeon]|nr:hypothetical protein [Candidatus Nanoarchaeia archaeon]